MTYTLSQTDRFEDWLDALPDLRARAAITDRLERVQAGNLGDRASVGSGVSELRIHVGPGYRLYYMMRGREMILLLCGGDKASQKRDIKQAKAMAEAIRAERT